jgi:type VI secretion system protein ImpK
MPAVAQKPVREVRFDDAASRLAELYAPVFAVIVQLRSTDQYGDPERLRQRLRDLIREAEQAAEAAGAPFEDIRDASFSVVAFLDEAILSSEWDQKDDWLARPLQLERFDRYDAGEFFFDRVRSVLKAAHRAEVLEMYYLCMTLGFKGKYQIHGQDELRQWIERAHEALSRAPGLAAAPLAPRGAPREAVAAASGRQISPWMIVAAAACVALLVYLGMSLYISYAASGTAETLRALSAAGAPTP